VSTIVQEIPQLIVSHLEDVAVKFGMEVNQENLDKLKQGWLEKQQLFLEKTSESGMEEQESFDPIDERAALLLTYSGSLIKLGPVNQGGRSVEYTSIGLRQDVPEALDLENAQMAESARVGEPLSFKDSPLKQTSNLYRIMVCPERLSTEEQDELMQDTATIIVDTFIGVNKDMLE